MIDSLAEVKKQSNTLEEDSRVLSLLSPELKQLYSNLEEQEKELLNRMTNQKWRMNNLYYVKNEKGQKVLFKLNPLQEEMFDNHWYLNLVLKSRQIGSTTFWCLFYFDSILFQDNKSCAIIAETRDLAKEIFRNKIQFALENFPSWFKDYLGVNTDTAQQLIFSNGSSISVTTTVRSGTTQYLLITEFGPICAKYPDKAREIIEGSFNSVHAGQYITVESTSKGMEGAFVDLCTNAMERVKKGLTESMLDFRFFFFPWYEDAKYTLDDPGILIPIDKKKYFDELEEALNIKLSRGQRKWYVKKQETQKDGMYTEFPSTPEEAFRASVEGAYYGKMMDKMMMENRVTTVPWDSRFMVDTWWDLGIGDYNVIVFVQYIGNEIRIIDVYWNEGEGLAHYAKILKEKPYAYRSHIAPHDIIVRELGTGKSRKEVASGLGIQFAVAPKLSIDDGIDAVRNMLSMIWMDAERTQKLFTALVGYRKEWDERLGQWRDKPRHDWTSHFADAVRMGAVGLIEYQQRVPYVDKVRGERVGFENPEDTRYEKHGLFNELF